MLIQHDKLRAVVRAICAAAGSTGDEPALVADNLVYANLTGHDSHGVGMIAWYVDFLGRDLIRPNTAATCVRDDGAVLMFDGARGYGQRVAREAMDAAIARCRETGVALMTLRGSCHIGRIGTYGEQALAAGVVSLHFVNVQDHTPLVAPHAGSDARFGTNPICVSSSSMSVRACRSWCRPRITRSSTTPGRTSATATLVSDRCCRCCGTTACVNWMRS